MKAAILCIGDELAAGRHEEANGHWLSAQLSAHGVEVAERRIVGDDRAAIAGALRELADRSDLLLVTGGLGPTGDDLTRQALGDVVAPGRELETDPQGAERLKRWFEGRVMPATNLVQAQRPPGTRLIGNDRGTAPGIAGHVGACRVFVMPGPPREMHGMFRQGVLPELALRPQALQGSVHAFGLSESEAGERLGELMDRRRDPRLGITADGAVVTAFAETRDPGGGARLEETLALIERRWAPFSFGRAGQTLAAAAGDLLRAAGRRLATAESCTGGLLGSLIVDVAGSSDYYAGGWVTYTDALKISGLGVPGDLVTARGAVSAEVALAMAEGALRRSGADDALAITGIAGPGGGSADKPVGTTWIALARRDGEADVRRFRYPGDRLLVRRRAAGSALQMLRLALLDDGGTPLLWQAAASAAPAEPRR